MIVSASKPQATCATHLCFDSPVPFGSAGLHGARERCGTIQLNKGGAKVRGDGFQAGGGVDMVLKYSGPDTRYHKVFIPSIDSSQHK